MVSLRASSLPRIIWEPPVVRAEQDCACAAETPRLWAEESLPAERMETDCACPDIGPVPTEVSGRIAPVWQLPPNLYRAALTDTHELVFNPTGPAGVVVLNEPARRVLDAFTEPRPLTDTTTHQLASLGLLTTPHRSRLTFAVPRTLTAWLHITGDCNLRCAYCYVSKSGEPMDDETGHAAVDGVFRSALAHGFRAVKLKYGGGEPTLNWPLVRSLHNRAQLLAARHNLELREVVLSNGTLLTEGMMDWLRGEDVRLMISLDGVGAAHDGQRPFADERSSFATVARNVDCALARGLMPYLSITVTAHNSAGLPDAVAFALERELPFNLNFVREPGVRRVGNLSYSDDHIVTGLKAAFAVIEAELPRRRLIDGLVDRSAFGALHEHPCGAGRNYMVIDCRGRVTRCQMAMDQPVTDVWADDPLQAVREWHEGFQNISVDEKVGCRDCTWRYWCAGGCPLLAYRTTCRSDVPSPYCTVYKALYPDVLLLEGLRLLKWQSPPN